VPTNAKTIQGRTSTRARWRWVAIYRFFAIIACQTPTNTVL